MKLASGNQSGERGREAVSAGGKGTRGLGRFGEARVFQCDGKRTWCGAQRGEGTEPQAGGGRVWRQHVCKSKSVRNVLIWDVMGSV